ncbi:MAG: DUF2304 domain-containing protein [Planctomycetes bacterium]|nr:DUF2304 domain-containing protein [Planctomycetota bacterium]
MSATLVPLLLAAAGPSPLSERQRFLAILFAVAVAVLVFELVRRRKLREEYSWLWVATSVGVAVLALEQDLLVTLAGWVGATTTASTLFLGALVFLMALVLQFSVRLSRLTLRQRTLAQRLAILEAQLEERGEAPRGVVDVKGIEVKRPRDPGEVA